MSSGDHGEIRHDNVQPVSSGPENTWFNRLCYQLPGEALVDEETNTVYIRLWFS